MNQAIVGTVPEAACDREEGGGAREKGLHTPVVRKGHLALIEGGRGHADYPKVEQTRVRRTSVDELVALIERCRRGDHAAYEGLINHCKGQVLGLAWRILGNGADAEDVAQEAFIKVFLRLGDLREPRAFPRWLSRITANLALQKVNSRKPWVELEEMETGPSSPVAPSSADGDAYRAAVGMELRRRIAACMGRLTPEQRAVLSLRDVQGYAYDEMAQILDIPLGTVKSRLNAARRCLRDELLRDGKGPIGAWE